jgi:hypothetical protein
MVNNMNYFNLYRDIKESADTSKYDSGVGYSAKVYKNKDGTHVAKFFKNNQHMTGADYQHKDRNEVEEFAQEEMEFRKKEAKKITERILEPQGHKESPDKISDGSDESNGKGKVKKMMGNRTPLEIITKILSK